MNTISFCWNLAPASNVKEVLTLLTTLSDEFVNNIECLSTSDCSMLFVDEATNFRLSLTTTFQENTINYDSATGAGEVFLEDGYYPILFFAALKQRIKLEIPKLADETGLFFCDQEGNTVELEDWHQFFLEVGRLGFTWTTLKQDAEAVGFVDKSINWSGLATSAQSIFF